MYYNVANHYRYFVYININNKDKSFFNIYHNYLIMCFVLVFEKMNILTPKSYHTVKDIIARVEFCEFLHGLSGVTGRRGGA